MRVLHNFLTALPGRYFFPIELSVLTSLKMNASSSLVKSYVEFLSLPRFKLGLKVPS